MIIIQPKGRYLRQNKVLEGDGNIVFAWHIISATDILASDWAKQITVSSTWNPSVKVSSVWTRQIKR